MGNQNPAANEYDFKRAIDILYLAVSVISYFTSHLPIVKEAVVYICFFLILIMILTQTEN